MKTIVSKLVLGIFFTLFAFNLNAQDYEYIPLVKSGVQIWTNDYFVCMDHYLFRRFALTEEDTIIENETYKKVYFFTDSVFNPLTSNCIGGLRENEQRQVFYKGEELDECVSQGMLYDFSLSVGDTFVVDWSRIYRITSIDTISIDNIKRREFSIALLYPESDTSFYELHLRDKWIEGIGSINGLLFNISYAATLCFNGGVNRCYEYNRELQYHDYSYGIEDCTTPYLGLNEIKLEDNSITLYPNPASKELNISSENIINSIEVFNSLGQSIYQEKAKSKEETIDISSFSKGVYIIGVSTDKGYIRKKLIKD
ncbi:MAG: hypothetical protein H6Q16_87 [Bacteroidetes bacterium]|nr:hypothetical protein [Bacteroidota bacterium]